MIDREPFPVVCACKAEPVAVTVCDDLAEDGITFIERTVGWVCPECCQQTRERVKAWHEVDRTLPVRERYNATVRAMHAFAERATVEEDGHFVVRKDDYEAYNRLVTEAQQAKAFLDALADTERNTAALT